MAVTVTACILLVVSKAFFGSTRLFLRCPNTLPALKPWALTGLHHEKQSSRADQITYQLPSPSSSQDTSHSPAMLGCSRHTDKGNLYIFSLIAPFGGFGYSFFPREGEEEVSTNSLEQLLCALLWAHGKEKPRTYSLVAGGTVVTFMELNHLWQQYTCHHKTIVAQSKGGAKASPLLDHESSD